MVRITIFLFSSRFHPTKTQRFAGESSRASAEPTALAYHNERGEIKRSRLSFEQVTTRNQLPEHEC